MTRTVYPEAYKNLGAFLDMLAVSEIGEAMLAQSDDGYNVVVGSTPGNLILFDSYADHPRRMQTLRPGLKSDGAGRYQILSTYWPHYARQLGLRDFGPEAQDAYAIQQIRERTAYADVLAGRVGVAMQKCKNIWASLPGAGYGQHENTASRLVQAFVDAGGVMA